MDAVSSRDYMIEVASASAQISLDISSIAQELILWSTLEFGFVELSDKFASTSSIMPQKKNPDVLEIIRARTGDTMGSFFSTFLILRSLPQSYNRDLQELSPIFFRVIENTVSSILILSKTIDSMKINSDKMNSATMNDFSTATELADLIVKEAKFPFRTAHQIVGTAISTAIQKNLTASELTTEFLDNVAVGLSGKKIGLSEEQITSAITPLLAVKSRKVIGGPAPDAVGNSIKNRFDAVDEMESRIREKEKKQEKARKMLYERVKEILEG
jgi:argininosuccinate lyase